MKEYWSRRIRDAVPYVPGEQPRGRTFIKLNTNENPYPPSPKVVEAVKSAAGEGLRLYPDPECAGLRAAAAKLHGVTPEQVFPGNGSDEVLAFCFQAFFDPERPILFADITYTFYAVYTDYFGLKAWQIPLDEDFSLPVERFCKAETAAAWSSPIPTLLQAGRWTWRISGGCWRSIGMWLCWWTRPMWTSAAYRPTHC